jgi:hypothetical protein
VTTFGESTAAPSLRRRRLSRAHSPVRGGRPAAARPAPARRLRAHHPAQESDVVSILSASSAASPSARPSRCPFPTPTPSRRLRRDGNRAAPVPRRLHLRGKIRPARPFRRRPRSARETAAASPPAPWPKKCCRLPPRPDRRLGRERRAVVAPAARPDRAHAPPRRCQPVRCPDPATAAR